MSDGAADQAEESAAQVSQSGHDEPQGPEAASAAELEALKGELAESHDKLLRLAAEIDNVRKRAAREVDAARRLGIERFAQALLPVIDSLEAGLAAENADAATLLEGKQATLKLLEQAFRDAGIASIDPRGEPFDPNLHEAISMLPVPDAAPESVVEVIQKGYALQERLLRPARVVVAQSRPPGE
jgi:molecular chaperone GrpE